MFFSKDAALDDLYSLVLFLSIYGPHNVGLEFQAEFVGFSAGPSGYIVEKIVAMSRHGSILFCR